LLCNQIAILINFLVDSCSTLNFYFYALRFKNKKIRSFFQTVLMYFFFLKMTACSTLTPHQYPSTYIIHNSLIQKQTQINNQQTEPMKWRDIEITPEWTALQCIVLEEGGGGEVLLHATHKTGNIAFCTA